jgi:hypothetical protein
MRRTVGISQKIKRSWLDMVLDHLVQGADEQQVRALLDEYLQSELPGPEARAKATGIVLRIWSGIDPQYNPIRDRAIQLVPSISGRDRIWLHWGMAALAYPFFRDVSLVVGRLLALQDDFTTAQVQDRMVGPWGDRTTTTEAVQKLITSYLDWGVLKSEKKGHFLAAEKIVTNDTNLRLWLIESLLRSSESSEIEIHQLLRLPESFPFDLTTRLSDFRKSETLEIHRQGLDMDMVALRTIGDVAKASTGNLFGT